MQLHFLDVYILNLCEIVFSEKMQLRSQNPKTLHRQNLCHQALGKTFQELYQMLTYYKAAMWAK